MPNNGSDIVPQVKAEQLWQFSLALYPKVKTVCLHWQDQLGANVNLVLLLCYLEQQQLSLSVAELKQLATMLNDFSTHFTQPLRTLRKNSATAKLSKTQQHSLKQALLQAELELEKLEQQLLAQHCPAPGRAAAALLDNYLALLTTNRARYQPQLFDLRQSIAQLR